MIRMTTNINGRRSLYGQLPNECTKKMWKIIDQFFKHNKMQATLINFTEGKTTRGWKASRTNFGRVVKKSKKFSIINLRDYQRNKRSIEIEVCGCATQYDCNCGG